MAYDNTNFYGDLIVSEYDDKGNFMTPPTPTGYYVYHILGDGFDLMSEMCNQFMNDYSILTASTKSLDNFWGVSYNMPRPLLYEGQKEEYLFIDKGTSASHNDNWTLTHNMRRTRNDNYTTLSSVGGTSQMAYPISNSTKFSGDITIEWDNYATTYQLNYFIISGTSDMAKTFGALYINKPCHVKITLIGTTMKCYINGVDKATYTFNRDANNQFQIRWQINPGGDDIKYKNFKIYTGEDKERPLTDDEYRIYLYLRNCRLMTREDIEINMNKCFAVEKENSQYYIFFSTETNYLSVVNHLNYNGRTTEESNLAKNDGDTSLNFITNFASDEDTLLIESGLSEVEEVIEVINVPSLNGYDPAFLELLENYISVKGNLKIKEYSI